MTDSQTPLALKSVSSHTYSLMIVESSLFIELSLWLTLNLELPGPGYYQAHSEFGIYGQTSMKDLKSSQSQMSLQQPNTQSKSVVALITEEGKPIRV